MRVVSDRKKDFHTVPMQEWVDRVSEINLMRTARKTNKEIGATYGVSERVIIDRIRRLRSAGHVIVEPFKSDHLAQSIRSDRTNRRRNHATNHLAMAPGGIAWAALWGGNPPPYPHHLVTGVFS